MWKEQKPSGTQCISDMEIDYCLIEWDELIVQTVCGFVDV